MQVPLEIAIEILSWLPVKSLLRFRCVSKDFLRLLTLDPHFIQLHLHRSSLIPNTVILIIKKLGRSPNTKLKYYSAEYDACDNAIELKVSFEESDYTVVGSCNGLFCLSNYYQSQGNNSVLHIWNPCTGDHITIPCPSSRAYRGNECYSTKLGFGFDQTNNEYKVVRIRNSSLHPPSDVGVYTLNTNLWRSLEDLPHNICSSESNTFLNGSLHWIGTRSGPRCWNSVISFNMKDEVFQELLLPCDVRPSAYPSDVVVGGLDGSLCLFHHRPRKGVEIWVMTEYGVVDSWTKKFKIRKSMVTGLFFYLEPLGRVKNGDFILRRNRQHAILYDPKGNSTKSLKPFNFRFYTAYGYVGTLVSPRVNHGATHNNEEAKFGKNGGKRKRTDGVSKEQQQ